MTPGDVVRRYRATGADLPYGDPLPAHGLAMEGYFWRFTDPSTGLVVVALNGVNRAADGTWATLGLAGGGAGAFLRTTAYPEGRADPGGLGASAGRAFSADDRSLRVDLGPDARLEVAIDRPLPWPRRSLGGSSVFQAVPGLNQYWHPWLLGGRATGTAVLGDRTWSLDGAQVYAEKNWGKGGFPEAWWWGQAQGFDEPDACVAFAGGDVTAGPVHTTVTAVVVRLPGGRTLRLGNPLVSPVQARVGDERWVLRGRGYGWRVLIEGAAPLAAAHVLPVPVPLERRNTAGAIEHLAGALTVRVERRGRLVWEGHSALAGLEHGGLARAEAELHRRGAPAGAVDAPPQGRDPEQVRDRPR